jgi:hypothetical protein
MAIPQEFNHVCNTTLANNIKSIPNIHLNTLSELGKLSH